MLLVCHLILIVLELAGFVISIGNRGAGILAYYTELSNLAAIISSVLLVAELIMRKRAGSDQGNGKYHAIVVNLRYLACCMLTMTFLVTVFYLVPITGDPVRMLFSGSQLYHHLLCPVGSTAAFILLEKTGIRRKAVLTPVIITFVYGMIMIALNYADLYDGPYPFFQINRIGVFATILWITGLLAVIILISETIRWLSTRNTFY